MRLTPDNTGKVYKPWTKEDMRKVLELWENHSIEQIAEMLNRKKWQIAYIANAFKKAGYQLPRKNVKGLDYGLVKEVLKEHGLI
jgi:hypothetical protein